MYMWCKFMPDPNRLGYILKRPSMKAAVRSQFRDTRLRGGVNWHDVDAARDMEVSRLKVWDGSVAWLQPLVGTCD